MERVFEIRRRIIDGTLKSEVPQWRPPKAVLEADAVCKRQVVDYGPPRVAWDPPPYPRQFTGRRPTYEPPAPPTIPDTFLTYETPTFWARSRNGFLRVAQRVVLAASAALATGSFVHLSNVVGEAVDKSLPEGGVLDMGMYKPDAVWRSGIVFADPEREKVKGPYIVRAGLLSDKVLVRGLAAKAPRDKIAYIDGGVIVEGVQSFLGPKYFDFESERLFSRAEVDGNEYGVWGLVPKSVTVYHKIGRAYVPIANPGEYFLPIVDFEQPTPFEIALAKEQDKYPQDNTFVKRQQ